jgi:hypothetical protein
MRVRCGRSYLLRGIHDQQGTRSAKEKSISKESKIDNKKENSEKETRKEITGKKEDNKKKKIINRCSDFSVFIEPPCGAL